MPGSICQYAGHHHGKPECPAMFVFLRIDICNKINANRVHAHDSYIDVKPSSRHGVDVRYNGGAVCPR